MLKIIQPWQWRLVGSLIEWCEALSLKQWRINPPTLSFHLLWSKEAIHSYTTQILNRLTWNKAANRRCKWNHSLNHPTCRIKNSRCNPLALFSNTWYLRNLKIRLGLWIKTQQKGHKWRRSNLEQRYLPRVWHRKQFRTLSTKACLLDLNKRISLRQEVIWPSQIIWLMFSHSTSKIKTQASQVEIRATC